MEETENKNYEHQFYNEFVDKCVDLLVECYDEYNSSEELVQYINDNWNLIKWIKENSDGGYETAMDITYYSLIHYLFICSDYRIFNSNDIFGELLPVLVKSENNFDELFEDEYLQYGNNDKLEEITDLLDSFIDEIRDCNAEQIKLSHLNSILNGDNYSGEDDYLIEVQYNGNTYLVTNDDNTLLDYGIIREYQSLEEFADMAEKSLVESVGQFLANEWLDISEDKLWETAKNIVNYDGHRLDIKNESTESGLTQNTYSIYELY